MLSEKTQKLFIVIYVLMILNLEVWLLSIVGLIFFGIGPALRTVTEQFITYGYNYRKYSLKEAWSFYRSIFWEANGRSWILIALICFLFYDLYVSSQIRQAWMLPLILITVFVLFMTCVVGINVLILDSNFEISQKDVFRLAFMQFFSDFRALALFMVGFLVIVSLTALWPGLLLFLTFSSTIVWANHSYQGWIKKIDGKIS